MRKEWDVLDWITWWFPQACCGLNIVYTYSGTKCNPKKESLPYL